MKDQKNVHYRTIMLIVFFILSAILYPVFNVDFIDVSTHEITVSERLTVVPMILHSLQELSFQINNLQSSFNLYTGLLAIPYFFTKINFSALFISLNTAVFISGFFYSTALFSLLVSISEYKLFRKKKWRFVTSTQILIVLAFFCNEFILAQSVLSVFIKNILLTTTIVNLIFYIAFLLFYYYTPYSTKRNLVKHDYKIYQAAIVLSIFIFIIKHLNYSELTIFVYIFAILLVAIVQNLTYKLKYGIKKFNYTLLNILLSLFLSLALTSIPLDAHNEELSNVSIVSKLSCILVFIFGIFTSYYLAIKREEQNKVKQVYLSQYIMLLKNYHKLLIDEKKTQVNEKAKKEKISLKEHTDNLCKHLKEEHKLTEREIEVLYLIWEGKTNKEIATDLDITLSTTKYHISNIYIKLNVNSRPQIFALKEG